MKKFKFYDSKTCPPLPIDVSTFLPPNHLARFVEEVVEKLDTKKIESNYSRLGQNAFHPKMILSIIFYGYMIGIRSSRSLEDACLTNMPFYYLSRGYKPKKSVLNNFRLAHYKKFKHWFIQILELANEEGILDVSTSIADGTKLRANASKSKSRPLSKYEGYLIHLEKDIDDIKLEIKELYKNNSNDIIENKKELLKNKTFKRDKITQLIALQKSKKELEEESKSEQAKKPRKNAKPEKEAALNLTDFDAAIMIGKKGNFDTFYNAQVGCTLNQFITCAYVTIAHNDKLELKSCIEKIEANTRQKILKFLADAGYSSFEVLQYLSDNSIIGYIPDQYFATDFSEKPYHKEHFKYDEINDAIICPQGQVLEFHRNNKLGSADYKVYKGINCADCSVRSFCTKAKARTIHRDNREDFKIEMRDRLNSEQGKAIYKFRLHTIEAIFGHFKQNLNYNHFLLRGIPKVDAEFKLMCLTYNLRKLAIYKGYKARNFAHTA